MNSPKNDWLDPIDPDGIILENRIREAQQRMWSYGIQGPVESRELIIRRLGPLVTGVLNVEDLRKLLKQYKEKSASDAHP